MAIQLRTDKGSKLLWEEADENFSSLFYSASISGNDLTLHYIGSTFSPSDITIPLPAATSLWTEAGLNIERNSNVSITGNLNVVGEITGSYLQIASLDAGTTETRILVADLDGNVSYRTDIQLGETGPQGPQGVQGLTGPQGPQGVQGPTGADGAVSPAGLNWQGLWISGTSYVENDAVGHGGASWFCINATSGTTTPDLDTANWALLASQGATGPQGAQGPTGLQGDPGTPGELQSFDEGNGIGYRLRLSDPVNYGNIGFHAIDFSESTITSSTYGATGRNSLALGYNTIASGFGTIAAGQDTLASGWGAIAAGYNATGSGTLSLAYGYSTTASSYNSVAFGTFTTSGGTGYNFTGGQGSVNTAASTTFVYGPAMLKASGVGCAVLGSANADVAGTTSGTAPTNPMIIIGNGTHTTTPGVAWTAISRSNLLVGLRNGTITLPSTTIPVIDAEATGRQIVTKEWVNNYKQDRLVSGTNISTINGQSLLAGGNITLSGGSVISGLTANFVPKATGTGSLGNSNISTDGSGNVAINYNNGLSGGVFQLGGTTVTKSALYGNGDGYFSGTLLINTTTDNGDDKLQVNGTVSSGATTLGTSQPVYNNQLTRKDYVDTADALKANLTSPAFTGTPTAPTATAGTNTTQIATTAFVTAADDLKANIASPSFTGTPAAPTATAGTSTTQIATTAFVQNAVSATGLTSGTYTPTYTNEVNTSSFVLDIAYYSRVGDLVTVNIGYSINFNANSTASVFSLTLPVSRNTNSIRWVGHGANAAGSQNIPVLVQTQNNTTKVNVYLYPGTEATGVSHSGHIVFTYSVN